MSFRSRASSRCSVRMKTVLASALRVQRRLALFSAADVWCGNPGFATLGGRRVCPAMACEIAVKREASNLGGTSLVTVRCQRESTWCQFFKKVCHASKAGAFRTVQTVCQLAMMADQATRPGTCESK